MWVVLRSIAEYEILLRESFHPDLLREVVDRDRYFDKLELFQEVSDDLAVVIPFECCVLDWGDILRFSACMILCELWGYGLEKVSDFVR